jgi:hypothetical protein
MAVSPPPTTARGWFRKAGSAPSQTAQAETPPRFEFVGLGHGRQRAVRDLQQDSAEPRDGQAQTGGPREQKPLL